MNKELLRETMIGICRGIENIYRLERENYQSSIDVFEETFGEKYETFLLKVLGKEEYEKVMEHRKIIDKKEETFDEYFGRLTDEEVIEDELQYRTKWTLLIKHDMDFLSKNKNIDISDIDLYPNLIFVEDVEEIEDIEEGKIIEWYEESLEYQDEYFTGSVIELLKRDYKVETIISLVEEEVESVNDYWKNLPHIDWDKEIRLIQHLYYLPILMVS